MTRFLTDEQKTFYKNVIRFAIPIILQNLLTSSAALVDAAMVVGLGNDATSAIGAAGRLPFFLNMICFGFSSGCASLMSQYWGAGDEKNVRRSAGFAMTMCMAVGLLLMGGLLFLTEPLMRIFSSDAHIVELGCGYLRIFAWAVPFVIFSQVMCSSFRATENVTVPMVSSFVAVGVNMFANWCFIFGNCGCPEMGIDGAAVGTVISMAVQSAIMAAALLFTDTPFRRKMREFVAFDKPFCKKYIKIAYPTLLNEILWGLGTNVYVMVYARQGIENHAGYTVYETLQQLFFVFFVGICGACSVMVGTRIGRGDHEDGYRAARRFAIMTPLTGVVVGVMIYFLRFPVLSLFPIETEAARTVAATCLLAYGLWIPVRMIPYTLICGVFRAGGDTKSGLFFELGSLYLFGIPAVLVLHFFVHPSNFVWYIVAAFLGEDGVKSILCLHRFRSRKWIQQITDKKEEEIAAAAE